MSSPTVAPEDMTNLPSKELLTAVDVFLDNNYKFRCSEKYKGFFGKVRAYFDKLGAEGKENRESCERYIEYDHYYGNGHIFHSDPFDIDDIDKEAKKRAAEKRAAEDRVAFYLEQTNTFPVVLMQHIKDKGKNKVDIYKRANIDRKLFSKISSRKDYLPSKRTIIALALALELSLEETSDLLMRAGFALSDGILFDVIIEYFISHGKYDIFEINNVLVAYKQPTLGSE